MFHLFLKRTADVLALRVSVVFRGLLLSGQFPFLLETDQYVTPIRKGSTTSCVRNVAGQCFRHIIVLPVHQELFHTGE